MTGLMAEIAAFWQQALVSGGLVFLRVGAIMALLPAFGEQSVPMRVRLFLTLAFTVALAPAVATDLPAWPEHTPALLRFAAIEVLAGLLIGIVFRLGVLALHMAGTIAANVTSLSQVFGNAGVDLLPAFGGVLVIGGLALAAMAGLHEKVLATMILSYELFPPGQGIDAAALSEWGVARVGRAFSLAFSLAAPFVIASLLYNLALGAINRAMPQLMVAFVGAPAITAGAMMLMAIAAPFLLSLWLDAFDASLAGIAAR